MDVSHNELSLYWNWKQPEKCQEIFDKYCLDAQQAGAQTLLLSSEVLYSTLPLLKIEHHVSIIEYIRYFPSYHESRLKQEIKNSHPNEIHSAYMKNRRVESFIDWISVGDREDHMFRIFKKINPDFNLGLYSYACRLVEKFDCKFFSFEAHKGNLLNGGFKSQVQHPVC
ncbi:hypothetical protein Defa_10960 [Desulfovibrio sp. TH_2024_36128]|uniref:Uncharacterized protein n=1 Tax=Desulfovibrio falkowii TaxID=3136602 RepID=A0ABQ0E795_9BACT